MRGDDTSMTDKHTPKTCEARNERLQEQGRFASQEAEHCTQLRAELKAANVDAETRSLYLTTLLRERDGLRKALEASERLLTKLSNAGLLNGFGGAFTLTEIRAAIKGTKHKGLGSYQDWLGAIRSLAKGMCHYPTSGCGGNCWPCRARAIIKAAKGDA